MKLKVNTKLGTIVFFSARERAELIERISGNRQSLTHSLLNVRKVN